MNDIEYTSDLLCHFVGREQSTEEAQYKLLLKIIKQDQTLYADVKHPENTEPHAELKMNYHGEQGGELYNFCPCVCFCDIPNKSLDIHCVKYSHFGLGFTKSFLISHGARPVTYIPQSYCMEGFVCNDMPKSPEVYYITVEKQLLSLINLLTILNAEHPFKDQLAKFFQDYPNVRNTIENYAINNITRDIDEGDIPKLVYQICGAWLTQCAYIKVYDDTLQKDDPYNYYMEREWRCLHNIEFSLKDIDTIYLPDSFYENEFKRDIPNYTGKFYILDNE